MFSHSWQPGRIGNRWKSLPSCIERSRASSAGSSARREIAWPNVCSILVAVSACLAVSGCFEDESALVLEADGSGSYTSTTRLNGQMTALAELLDEMQQSMAESFGGPAGSMAMTTPVPLSEAQVRAQVGETEHVRIVELHSERVGQELDQASLSVHIEFDDIRAFLQTTFAEQRLGLQLSRSGDEGVRLHGSPGGLSSSDATSPGLGDVPFALMGLGDGDATQDERLARLTGHLRSTLTIALPTAVRDANAVEAGERTARWEFGAADILRGAAAGEVMVDIAFDVHGLALDASPLPKQQAVQPPALPAMHDEAPAAVVGDATVQVLGLQVGRPVEVTTRQNGSTWSTTLDPFMGFGWEPATTVAFHVVVPGGVEQLDIEACALDTVQDDLGNDYVPSLTAPTRFEWQPTGGEHSVVRVVVPMTPKAGCSALSLAGTLVLLQAAGAVATYEEAVSLDAPRTFQLGEVAAQWSPGAQSPFPGGPPPGMFPPDMPPEAMPPMFGGPASGPQATLELAAGDELLSRLEVEFLSATGPVNIEDQHTFGGPETSTHVYTFPGNTEAVTLRAVLGGRRPVAVPFDVEVGLGMD